MYYVVEVLETAYLLLAAVDKGVLILLRRSYALGVLKTKLVSVDPSAMSDIS